MARGPTPPYLRVAAGLRKRVQAGEWGPGEALPSATELAEQYETSTSTVGRAIKVLAGEGLVTSVQGWGVFIPEGDQAE
jgi:DNA-binding GntR family transcriptional regulator